MSKLFPSKFILESLSWSVKCMSKKLLMIGKMNLFSEVRGVSVYGIVIIPLLPSDIKSADMLGQPSAILHVVNPSYLGKFIFNRNTTK